MVLCRIPSFNTRVLQLLLALLLPLATSAQVNVTVDATKTVRTVDDRHFGANTVMWDRNAGTSQTVDLVKAAGLRAIRLPGGSLSDEYDWSTNTGYSALGVFNTWSWFAGMDQFTQLVTGSNSQAIVVANYGSGTPEQAAAWVAWANADANLLGTSADVALGVDALGVDWKTAGYWSALRAASPLSVDDKRNTLRINRSAPLGFKYWSIGNEVFGSWEADFQAVAHDPYTYAVRTKQYLTKMRAVDPTVKIGVVVENTEDAYTNNTSHPATNPRTGQVHNGWTPVLLTTLKSLGITPDYLDYHYYPQNPGKESDVYLLQVSSNWATYAANIRAMANDYLGTTAAANVELLVTENNSVSSDGGKQMSNLVNGLFYADSLGALLQTEFNSFYWWALRNGPGVSNGAFTGNMSSSLYGWRMYGEAGVLTMTTSVAGGPTDYYTPLPVYYTMKLMSLFARGGDTVVKVTSDNTLLSSYAVLSASGTLNVIAINKSPTATYSTTFKITGFPMGTTADVYSYGVTQDNNAKNNSGSPDVSVQTGVALNGTATGFTISVPAYTAVVYQIKSTVPSTPAAPYGISANPGEAMLSWTLPSPRCDFILERATSSDFSKGLTTVYSGACTSFLDSGLTANTTYYYRLACVNSSGTSPRSPSLTLQTPAAASTGSSKLSAISTRVYCGVDNNVAIGGFVISGGPKKVFMQAVGPSLTAQGLSSSELLQDPVIEVHDLQNGNKVISNNDNWGDNANAAEVMALGKQVSATQLLPTDTTSSAAVLTLQPGVYSFVITGKNRTKGIVLVEVYDGDPAGSVSKLSDISTRADCLTDNNVAIGGFVISGSASKRVLLRGVGTTMITQGLTMNEILQDPVIEVHDPLHCNPIIAVNDNWGDNKNASLITTTGDLIGATALIPSDQGTSALLFTLPPGVYSFIAKGNNSTQGIVLVEIYDAD